MTQLAQFNISTLLHPLDHPATADFTNALPAINALGDNAAGFVWRLQTDDGDATALQAYPDPMTIVNLTVWEDVASLKEFSYRSGHGSYVRRRDEWFASRRAPDGSREPHVALWWVPDGHRPHLEEARARLELLRRRGPGPWAFTFASAGQPTLTVHRVALDGDGPDTDDAISLILRLNAHLAEEYPTPGANHFRLAADEVAPGRGAFLLARLDGVAVGCGAVRLVEEPTGAAEIKRMYTAPEVRGTGLGATLVALLEAEARALRATSLVLETGITSDGAIATYRSAGFSTCACWGEYLDTPDTSLCMRKALLP